MRIVIEVYTEMDEFQPQLLSEKTANSIFYTIDAVSDFFNPDGRVIGSEINCQGALYYSPLKKEEVDSLIMYNQQEL